MTSRRRAAGPRRRSAGRRASGRGCESPACCSAPRARPLPLAARTAVLPCRPPSAAPSASPPAAPHPRRVRTRPRRAGTFPDRSALAIEDGGAGRVQPARGAQLGPGDPRHPKPVAPPQRSALAAGSLPCFPPRIPILGLCWDRCGSDVSVPRGHRAPGYVTASPGGVGGVVGGQAGAPALPWQVRVPATRRTGEPIMRG